MVLFSLQAKYKNMSDVPVSFQYKVYANNIVGTWYNRMPNETLIFSFLNDVTDEAELLTHQNGAVHKSTYNLIFAFDNYWYLQIWSKEGKKNNVYRIEILTASILTVSNRDNKVATYQRKVDYAYANNLLDFLVD